MERAKEHLAENEDFNLLDAFAMLDPAGRGNFNDLTLEQVMKKIGVNPSEEALKLYIQRYDMNEDGEIVFKEFCESFLPKNEEKAKELMARPSTGKEIPAYGKPHAIFRILTQGDLETLWRAHFRIEAE